ncbi:LuxR family transcriptional regulator [Paenibacillus albiflavus]|uniref:LuxR family transcriptional regulator n=2 Tax=Paenibacillus albiflavus TaxID=2545760 RepID=A0A4R4E990_9BACL|nr:LuxR family transcriptional regulator [Paenibacillus albiflavus]
MQQTKDKTSSKTYIPSPPLFVSQSQFDIICKQNQTLISVFAKCISDIKEYLTGSFVFLLTDAHGVLLTIEYSKNLESTVRRSPIRLGMYFTEKSCGVNAISEAMSCSGPIYLRPEQHENAFFHTWHCFSTPLTIDGENIGFLDVSTVNEDMKTELIAIAKLLSEHLLSGYRSRITSQVDGDCSIKLTDRQLHVLKLIAQGHTVKSIALIMKIKECTVNHHKKIIFDKLGVRSSTEAVLKVARLPYFQKNLYYTKI